MASLKGIGSPSFVMSDIDFAMESDAGVIVRCMITQGALDDLAAVHDTRIDHLRVFSNCRTVIERIASRKYDAGILDCGMVVIGPADLRNERLL